MRRAAALALAFALLAAPPAAADPARWRAEWPRTDFGRSTVDFAEILAGGPPKDGIPAIDAPRMIPVAAETALDDREPVITLELDGALPRAYPVRYLMWHEFVNDTVDGRPVAVTYCPLCNAALVFDPRVGGELRTFGVSGMLRHSDMVMYDRQTESWWQQALGEGIVGAHSGDRLVQLPSWMEGWADFRARNPGGLVMDRPDWPRAYGRNPYVGYDLAARPFLYAGEDPPHGIHPLARVVRVDNRAWPLERVRAAGTLTEEGITIAWSEGQASALDDGRLGAGREVGSVRVRDASGRDLAHDVPFAFAFHALFPDGRWMLGR